MNAARLLALGSLAFLGFAAPAVAGGPLTSAVIASGTLSGPSFTESWTFSGTIGERVLLIAVTTGGAVNTNMALRAPGGTLLLNTSADRVEYQLTSSGVHTVEISDQGLNDAGTYSLQWLNLTAGPLTHAGDLDGGPIGSGDVVAASAGAVADADAFTFSGTAGQRVLFGALEGSIAPFNVMLTLYPPGGGGAEASTGGGNRIDAQLAATGTYTVVVEDVGNDHTGNYTVSLLNVSAGPHSTISDPDGGAIPSATSTTGTVNGVVDFDAFTVSGTAGDRIAVVALTTSGTLNTNASLYPPNGGAVQISSSGDRWDFQLTQTGTHTIVIEDQSFGETGTYTVSFINLTAGPLTHAGDLDGGPIASGEVLTGTTGGVTDIDAFTFTGTTGDRALFGVLEGTAPPYNVILTLYPPGGGGAVANTGGGNRLDVQLGSTGTYVVVVEDIGNNDSGGYTVSHLNVTAGPHSTLADPDGGAIPSATAATGTINGVVDWDAFTVTGAAGDRIAVVALTTSGALNTTAYLYPPNGGAAQISSAGDRWDFQLTQSGTHTLVIEDQTFGETGTYRISFLNLTSGPLTTVDDPDGGPIASGEVRPGSVNVAADLDAFTFTGTAGDRALFGVIELAPSPFNVPLTLYPPGGGAQVASTGGGNRLDVQLATTGTYVVVVEDVGNDTAGPYEVTHLNVTAGPHTTGLDPDGAAVPSATSASGTMNGPIDWDAFTLTGNLGDRILVLAPTTSGAMNTTCYLYPPNGGAAQVNTAADRWEFQLTQSGTHTIVIEDQAFGQDGTYALHWLNLTSGPYTYAGDLDGDAIGSNEVRGGSIGPQPDVDGFTFPGTLGDRVVIGGVATGGAGFNTVLTLYPPGGGPLVVGTGGSDRIDYQLASTGTYTLVVEDAGDDNTGTYGVSFVNLLAGPVSTVGDPQGGTMNSGDVRFGSVSPVPDFDVYWFFALPGDTAIVSCVTTSGPLNTQTYLYPPNGGAAVVSTASDSWSYAIQASGRHALLVQHQDLTLTGDYQLNLNGPLTPVDVPVRSPVPATLTLSGARPNPSSGISTFSLALPERGPVQVRLFDLRGARVRTLVEGVLEPGTHPLAWDGRDEHGRRLASGVYLAQVRVGDVTFTRRVVRVE